MRSLFGLLICWVSLQGCLSAPEQGLFKRTLDNKDKIYIVKTLYKDSIVKITITGKKDCKSEKESKLFWQIRSSSCFGAYSSPSLQWQKDFETNITFRPANYRMDGKEQYLLNYQIKTLGTQLIPESNDSIKCSSPVNKLLCYNDWKTLAPLTTTQKTATTVSPKATTTTPAKTTTTTATTTTTLKTTTTKAPEARKKRDLESPDDGKSQDENENSASDNVCNAPKDSKFVVAVVPEQSYYLFYSWLEGDDESAFDVTIELKSPVGYLSAHEYPLLTFYMCMCILYSFYAVIWLVMSACNYRELLRVQFWIGGVILLGMVEKAVFYSEYLSVDQSGVSVPGAARFAEVVSAMKRTVARMLVIIVSLGFGIVKPRLGPMLHRIIVVGGLYFVLAIVESMIRNESPLHDPDNKALLLSFIPLAILDAVICWWVFMSLLQTMKTLRLRRNTTKLSLYRHFSNTIIFCVIASIIMILWSSRIHNARCVEDWPELWVDTAFWHILFSIILLVIMVLWRPNANNQRYAYSPMVDGNESDEDDQEPMLSGALETVKMRGGKQQERQSVDKTEEDLKWIEENIPQTIADIALPVLESDEEEISTKYEMSKMD